MCSELACLLGSSFGRTSLLYGPGDPLPAHPRATGPHIGKLVAPNSLPPSVQTFVRRTLAAVPAGVRMGMRVATAAMLHDLTFRACATRANWLAGFLLRGAVKLCRLPEPGYNTV